MHYWFNGWHMIWMTTHGWPQLGCYSHSSGSGLVPWVSITGGTVLQAVRCRQDRHGKLRACARGVAQNEKSGLSRAGQGLASSDSIGRTALPHDPGKGGRGRILQHASGTARPIDRRPTCP